MLFDPKMAAHEQVDGVSAAYLLNSIQTAHLQPTAHMLCNQHEKYHSHWIKYDSPRKKFGI